jgi:hypothetical protein
VRSIAVQTLEELGGPGSVLARQRRDHARLEELLEALPDTTGAAQDEAVQELYRLVFPHAYAEETVVWPVVRRVLPDGEALTLRLEQEHQEINALATRIDRTPPGPDRDGLLAELAGLLRQDARDEEDVLLARLQDACTAGQLRRLGRSWEAVRRTAPTRPHALVSRRPPGNLVSALPLAVLDRTRDGLDVAARRTGPAAGAARRLSGLLAAAAGAVERVPAVQRGERPSTAGDGPPIVRR